MRKTKLQAANLEGNADDVEAAFYDALQNADIEKLMACWADEDEIVCIHPGGLRLARAGAQDRIGGQQRPRPARQGCADSQVKLVASCAMNWKNS
jgi:hypothetical protein